jgi:acetyl esterase/lipase
MAIVSEKDQAIVNDYNTTVQNGFAKYGGIGGPRPGGANQPPPTPQQMAQQLDGYRKVMALITRFLSPPGFVAAAVASFQAERPLRPGLTASIAVPKGKGPFPMWVHAHGHGLRAGHPSEYEPWIRLLASYGIVVVFPDYRLQPESSYEDQVDDMNFAVKWTKEHAGELHGVADRMIIGGDSAGAHLAFDVLMRALKDPAGVRFQAFACVDGQMNGPQAEELMAQIGPDTPLPPLYLEAGSADTNAGIPVANFEVVLRKARKNFAMNVSYDMPHDFIKFAQMDAAQEANRRMCEFLVKAV